MTTVNMRVGDCVDFAILLCCLLRGCGYNAYCVAGYAPQYITTLDQTRTVCPLIAKTNLPEKPKPKGDRYICAEEKDEDDTGDSPAAAVFRVLCCAVLWCVVGVGWAVLWAWQCVADANDLTEEEVHKYGASIRHDPQHESTFLARRAKERAFAEHKRRAGLDPAESAAQALALKVAAESKRWAPEADPLYARRAHCWVMVRRFALRLASPRFASLTFLQGAGAGGEGIDDASK
jgi:hypothetical protein